MKFNELNRLTSTPTKYTTSTITVLVGPPGIGKDTWLSTQYYNGVVISRDQILVDYVEKNVPGLDYSTAWRTLSESDQKEIDRLLQEQFTKSLKSGIDIIVNMTNMSKKSRRKWLLNVPSTYKKRIVCFITSLENVLDRNSKRIGKQIPPFVIEQMVKGFMIPTKDEADTIDFIFN
jgi:predicted kinase